VPSKRPKSRELLDGEMNNNIALKERRKQRYLQAAG
jgi:hypothetical protein